MEKVWKVGILIYICLGLGERLSFLPWINCFEVLQIAMHVLLTCVCMNMYAISPQSPVFFKLAFPRSCGLFFRPYFSKSFILSLALS